ncbi:MAG: hypothetical protein BA863_00125 [Desulfovibrio sp. S3730MH75]|nr:MAG: hypothetical protein BA863_00125 [Desulfovibrio sp. S3730MH75]
MDDLPTFFIVGAQKTGTSSLHDWLRQQPDICLPKIKETHYFAYPERYRYGLDWYLEQFSTSGRKATGRVMGEIDPEYMFFSETPKRISQLINNPKIIFIFRNPIERAFSQYQMSVARGYEDLSFIEALEIEQDRLANDTDDFSLKHHSYLSRGRYAEQVQRYLQAFPKSDFLFIKFKDMVSDDKGEEMYGHICSFIGLKSDPAIADRTRRSNEASEPISMILRNIIHRGSKLRRLIGKTIPSYDLKLKIWLAIDRLNRRPLKHKETLEYHRIPNHMIMSIKNEVKRLQQMTNLDFDDWLEKMSQCTRLQKMPDSK